MSKPPILIFYRNACDPACFSELNRLIPCLQQTHSNLQILGDIDVKNYNSNVASHKMAQERANQQFIRQLQSSSDLPPEMYEFSIREFNNDIATILNSTNKLTEIFIALLGKYKITTYKNINPVAEEEADIELMRERQSYSVAEKLINAYQQSDNLILVVLNLNLAKFMKPKLQGIATQTFFLYSILDDHIALSQYNDELEIRSLYRNIAEGPWDFSHIKDPLYLFDHVYCMKTLATENHNDILYNIRRKIGPFFCTIGGTPIQDHPISEEGFEYLRVSLLCEQSPTQKETSEEKNDYPQNLPIIHLTDKGIFCCVQLSWLEKLFKIHYEEPARSALDDFCDTTGILSANIFCYFGNLTCLAKRPAPVLIFYKNRYDIAPFTQLLLLLPKLEQQYPHINITILSDIDIQQYPLTRFIKGAGYFEDIELSNETPAVFLDTENHNLDCFKKAIDHYKLTHHNMVSTESLKLKQRGHSIAENILQYCYENPDELIVVILDINLAEFMRLTLKTLSACTFYMYSFTKEHYARSLLLHKQEAEIQEYYSKGSSARDPESPLHLFDDAFQIEEPPIPEKSQTIWDAIMQAINASGS